MKKVKKKKTKVEEPSLHEEKEMLGKTAKDEFKKIQRQSTKATIEMAEYLKANRLDPNKDWTKHPKHGETISKWVKIIRKAERMARHQASALAEKKAKEKLVKPNVRPKIQTVKKAQNIYDYPDVDGMPMPSGMRKKYRSRMRALMRANMSREEAQKKALASALNWVPEVDPLQTTKSRLKHNVEVEGSAEGIQSVKRTTEGPKKSKKEKTSKKNRKEMANLMKERKARKGTIKEYHEGQEED